VNEETEYKSYGEVRVFLEEGAYTKEELLEVIKHMDYVYDLNTKFMEKVQ